MRRKWADGEEEKDNAKIEGKGRTNLRNTDFSFFFFVIYRNKFVVL